MEDNAMPCLPVPHTEFGVLNMDNDHKPQDIAVKEKLNIAVDILGHASGHPIRFFTCPEEAHKVFLIYGWDKIEQHTVAFLTSQGIDDLVEEMEGYVDMTAMWHSEIAFAHIVWDTPIMTFARFHVPEEHKDEFQSSVQKWLPTLKAKCSAKISTGWKVPIGFHDRDEGEHLEKYAPQLVSKYEHIDPRDCDEWNILIPWNDAASAKTEFKIPGFLQSLEYVARLQVRHMERLDISLSE